MMPNQAPQIPQATPAPIHDIAGPLWIFPYPVWMVVLIGLGFLVILGFLIWLLRRRAPVRPLTPRERAQAAIESLRKEGGEGDPYAFGVKVSDALRAYIRDQYKIDATTRTSVEFLESLRDNLVFSANEKAALAEFLESVDLLKYARQEAGSAEIRVLLEIADRLVQGEQPLDKTPAK
jgi:Domain of unknown function (DUF4381)